MILYENYKVYSLFSPYPQRRAPSLTLHSVSYIVLLYTPQLTARFAGVLGSPVLGIVRMETVLLIDGENFKGKIKAVFKGTRNKRPAWHEYDFKGLLNKVLNGIEIKRLVFYFARLKMHPDSREKSQQLLD